MENNDEAFMDDWPKVSFEEIATCQEKGAVGVFYTSFFSLLSLPQTVVSSLITLLKEEVG